MFIYLLIILCILYILFDWRCKANSAKLPSYPGALPLIGHAHLLIGDNIRFWGLVKDMSMECVKQGGGISLFLGPFVQPMIADPGDCGILLNTSLDRHELFTFVKDWFGEGVVAVDASMWPKHRKLLNPMFTQQVLNGFLDLFNEQAKRLASQLAAEEGNGPFNIERHMLHVGLETICRFPLLNECLSVLGKHSNNQVENEEYLNANSELLAELIERLSKIWLHNDYIFNWSSLKKKHDTNLKLVHQFSDTVLRTRKELLRQKSNEDAGEFKPFVDRILKVTMENENFTDKEIGHELNALIVAGYDTTASELVFVLMLLGHYQNIQHRVYEELQEVFNNSDREVEKQDLPRLVYMEAVLKETIRLYPVIPFLARYNRREVKLQNCTLPAGSNCFISVYGLHRHPVWGPDAEEFRPERWLDPASLPDIPNAYGGFGLGRRACIGKTYAMMSMKITLVHMLRRYRVFADITKLVLKFDFLLKPASGQNITIEPRT